MLQIDKQIASYGNFSKDTISIYNVKSKVNLAKVPNSDTSPQ